MIMKEFKNELNLISKFLESKFQDYYYKVVDNDDEIILECNFGSFRLRIFFDKDNIRCNILTFDFDISTSYVDVDYNSGLIFYEDLKEELLKVVTFFDSYVNFYN